MRKYQPTAEATRFLRLLCPSAIAAYVNKIPLMTVTTAVMQYETMSITSLGVATYSISKPIISVNISAISENTAETPALSSVDETMTPSDSPAIMQETITAMLPHMSLHTMCVIGLMGMVNVRYPYWDSRFL